MTSEVLSSFYLSSLLFSTIVSLVSLIVFVRLLIEYKKYRDILYYLLATNVVLIIGFVNGIYSALFGQGELTELLVQLLIGSLLAFLLFLLLFKARKYGKEFTVLFSILVVLILMFIGSVVLGWHLLFRSFLILLFINLYYISVFQLLCKTRYTLPDREHRKKKLEEVL